MNTAQNTTTSSVAVQPMAGELMESEKKKKEAQKNQSFGTMENEMLLLTLKDRGVIETEGQEEFFRNLFKQMPTEALIELYSESPVS